MNQQNERSDAKTYRFEIFRYDASDAAPPHFDAFEVTADASSSVLTALLTIQEQQDPTLAFRYSCRGLVCGSCGMVVNGRLTLACRTLLETIGGQRVVVEPLPGFDVLKDLVVDMEPFWEHYRRIEPWLHGDLVSGDETRMTERDAVRLEQFANCILCGLCSAACPVTKFNEDFTGPAALAKLYRFVVDPREKRRGPALQRQASDDGMWGCRTVNRCIEACPKNVRPRDGIAGLRRTVLVHALKDLFSGKRHED
jgi:succinate dehydrogenase / fumarate reductase iron-sulfur subunit